jgi:hypothetical protein
MKNLGAPLGIALFLSISILVSSSAGQSSLFNIPTTDILPKGEKYIEADFDAHFAPYRSGGWQSYGVVGVYGLNDRVEIGLNAYTLRAGDGFETAEIQPNLKVKAYESESLGLTISTGAIAYFSLNKRIGKDATVSAYAVASKSFKSDWAPRLTAGAYQLLGATPDSSESRGLLLGVEQPVHKRVSLITDWNTGKNRFGYASAGVGITLTKRSYLYSAYYFGNEGRANNSLGIYYGLSF